MTEHRNPSMLRIGRVFSVLAGIGGFVHGVGEFLQGNTATGGMYINSWAEGPIALYMGGEPAFTILPNFQLAGLLTMIASLSLILWAVFFIENNRAGLGMFIVSTLMLLFGGGVGPPVVGLLAAISGSRIGSSFTWWEKRFDNSIGGFLSSVWSIVWLVCLSNGLFLFIGANVLPYLGFNQPDWFTYSFFLSVPLMLVTTVTGIAYDIRGRTV